MSSYIRVPPQSRTSCPVVPCEHPCPVVPVHSMPGVLPVSVRVPCFDDPPPFRGPFPYLSLLAFPVDLLSFPVWRYCQPCVPFIGDSLRAGLQPAAIPFACILAGAFPWPAAPDFSLPAPAILDGTRPFPDRNRTILSGASMLLPILRPVDLVR